MSTRAESPDKLWSKDFILITLVNTFLFIGFQMLLPTLPIYAKELGGNEAMAGLVIGIFTVSSVLIRPFAGRALDLYGRRGVFLAGLAIFILSVLSYIWVPTVGILLLFRFIHGFGWGSSSTAVSTIASDVIPRSRLGEGMGYFGLTGTLAMALAPALGLYIVGGYSFNDLFLISAAMVAVSSLLALGVSYHKVSGPLPAQAREVKPALLERASFRPACVVFFVTMTYGAVVSFLALYASKLGIPNIGSFFTVYAISLMAARPLFGRLADKKGFDLAVIPGIIAVLITMLILFKAQTLAWFLVAGVVYGIGFGAVQPSLQAMAVMHVPPNRRGAANGTFYTGFDLGIGVGSVLWGAVAQVTGYSLMYLWAALPALISLVVYWLVGRTAKDPQAAN